jgi:hypothetical protein
MMASVIWGQGSSITGVDPVVARVLAEQQAQTQGSNRNLILAALAIGAGWYWWTRRKRA